MKRISMLLGATATLLVTFGTAQAEETQYANLGRWRIVAVSDQGRFAYCGAETDNGSVSLRIATDGNEWQLGVPYYDAGPVRGQWGFDGWEDEAYFRTDGDGWATMDVSRHVLESLHRLNNFSIEIDRGPQHFSLRGSSAALRAAVECARNRGVARMASSGGAGNAGGGIASAPRSARQPVAQNVGDSLTNEYGGYDIGGTPEGEEDFYGQVRGWRVFSGRMGGKFAYCVGEIDDRGSIWRLGWDGMQWQAAVVADVQPDWNGYLDVDGDSRPISGSAKGGWALLWLGMPELDKIRQGNRMIVDVGRASIEHPLVGTAAVVTKIEECVARQGASAGRGQAGLGAGLPVASRPAGGGSNAGGNRGNAGGAGCPDDGPRLPITGICAGRAVAYLGGMPTYGDYLPDPSCDWVVNEVQIVEDALLYRALRCKGVTAQLEFAGGAHWAQLMVVRSALNAAYGERPDVRDPQPAVWFNWIDPNDVEGQLDMRSRLGFEAELRGRSCAIERADPAVSPDGWVFDITPSDPMYAQSQQEPIGAQCGPFSYGDGSVRFWRVLGDQAFLFDMSADIYQDFDPNTVTLLRKDPSGSWVAVE